MRRSINSIFLSLLFLSVTISVSVAQIVPSNKMPKVVLVEGGTFYMGSNKVADEKPIHQVTVSDFYIGKYEISVGEYKTYCRFSGTKMPPVPTSAWYTQYYRAKTWTWNDNHPIANISWNEAAAYCKWLSKTTGKKYRLPTEAEWEFAAKGGKKSKNYRYSGNNDVKKVAWYDDTTNEEGTRPVGKLKSNELGIYDMSGNVWEWCGDRYGRYLSKTQENPTGPSAGIYRVCRGGSWYYFDKYSTVTSRDGPKPTYRSYNHGFRVIMEKE